MGILTIFQKKFRIHIWISGVANSAIKLHVSLSPRLYLRHSK